MRRRLESLEAGDADDGSVVAVEALRAQELTNLNLDELEDFLVVNHVSLVQGHEQVGNANLLGEKNVLTGLCHRTVSGGNHEDCTVHLSGTGDHVLDVVSVTGGVNVCVVTLLGLVLDVRDVDGDTTLLLFRSGVNRREVAHNVDIRGKAVSEHLGNGSGQSGLAVVDVTNRSEFGDRKIKLHT